MADIPDLDALAATLGIEVRAGWWEAVRVNYAISLRFAGEVASFPLDDAVELAPVFRP